MASRALRFPLVIVLALMQATACASVPEEIEARTLEIPYLTTRAFKLKDDGDVKYSTDVAETTAGSCAVLLDDDTEDVSVRVKHYGVRPVDEIISRFDDRADEGLLVYIHGYNVGVERGCRDAAQVAYRTGFEGRLLLFSWPASRTVVTYRKDEKRMIESMPAIVSALGVLSERFGAGRINVIAHSMGSRAIVSSIESAPTGSDPLNNLILIAPDIDRDVFEEALPELQQRVSAISVLVADSDRLLMLSQTINLGERLGQAVDFDKEGVEIIDVTGLDDLGMGNHVYHLSNERVGDILRMILNRAPPAEASKQSGS